MINRDPETPLELGKYYIDRLNRVVGPLKPNSYQRGTPFVFEARCVGLAVRMYTCTGRFHADGEPSHADLVKGPLTKAQVFRERPSVKHLVRHVPKTRLTGSPVSATV